MVMGFTLEAFRLAVIGLTMEALVLAVSFAAGSSETSFLSALYLSPVTAKAWQVNRRHMRMAMTTLAMNGP